MSERQNYIRAVEASDQSLTAETIRRIAAWFDLADDQRETAVYPELFPAGNWKDSAWAWMWAALLITDVAEVDSHTLRTLANSISQGVQDALPF